MNMLSCKQGCRVNRASVSMISKESSVKSSLIARWERTRSGTLHTAGDEGPRADTAYFVF